MTQATIEQPPASGKVAYAQLIETVRSIALHRGTQNGNNQVYVDDLLYISVDTETQRVWVSVHTPAGVIFQNSPVNQSKLDWTAVLDITDEGTPETMMTWVTLMNSRRTWVDRLTELAQDIPAQPSTKPLNFMAFQLLANWNAGLLKSVLDEFTAGFDEAFIYQTAFEQMQACLQDCGKVLGDLFADLTPTDDQAVLFGDVLDAYRSSVRNLLVQVDTALAFSNREIQVQVSHLDDPWEVSHASL